MSLISEEFRAGQESPKIDSARDALLRAVLVAIAIAVAWVCPVPLWAKVLIFFGVMFVIGILVQLAKGTPR
jgi:hypothetical protein